MRLLFFLPVHFYLLLGFFMLYVSPLASQEQGAQQVLMGDWCMESNEYESAKDAYLDAYQYYEAAGDYHRMSYLNLWLSEAFYSLGALDRAMEQAQLGRHLIETHLCADTISFYATLLQNIGVFNSQKGNLDAQMQWYERACEAAYLSNGFYSSENADALLNLGFAYGYRGDWNRCISLTDSSLQISERVQYRAGIASALLNLAHAFAAKEDFQKAITFQNRALQLTDSKEERARGLNNLGTYYTDLKQAEKALGYLEEAKMIREELYNEYDDLLISTRLNIIYAYSELGNIEQAEPIMDELIRKLDAQPALEYYLQIALNYKAKLLLNAQQPYRALEVIAQALPLDHNGKAVKAGTRITEAEIYLQLEQYSSALQAINQGIAVLVPSYSTERPLENPAWKAIDPVDQARVMLKLKGDILREQGVERKDISLLLASYHTLQKGDSLIMWTRRNFHNQKSKEVLSANANELYASLLATLYELYSMTNESTYFDQALACMEKNKSLSILENLNRLYANSFSGVPDKVVEDERALQKQIGALSARIKLAGDRANPEQKQIWEKTLYEKQRELEELLSLIARQYPRYFQMKHQLSSLSSKELSEQLIGEDEAFIAYFAQGSQLLILAVDGDRRYFYNTECTGLADKITQLREAAINQSDEFYALSYQLYECILMPVLRELDASSLAIAADGILAYLPFELLLTAPVSTPFSLLQKELPYLLVSHRIRYLLSANTALSASRYTQVESGKILAMAPQFENRSSTEIAEREVMDALPGAQAELDSLDAMFLGAYLKGASASEAYFKQHCNQYGVFHIATHTKINDEVPSASYLLLEEGKGEDGRLYAWEMYNLELGASLAVLSGCNTGIGQLKQGEGSAGLAHAFAYAGCPNLVMTLWPVRDNTTPILMSAFYDNLNKGMEKPEALRQAKLHCLRNDELFAHPYYWSGFIYVGDAGPLSLQKRFSTHWWWVAIALLLGFTAFLIWKRR
jgi:CHAT domain-containing protein